MDTKHLRAFLKIVELGSITRAAEATGVAQPSLSQLLQRLEDEVGAKLFRRTARGVKTTEAGRVFQEHALHLVASADRALEDVRRLKVEVSGDVTFAMPISVSMVIGLPLVEAILKHAPLVSLRLIDAFSGHIRTWLDEGSIDLGILYEVGPLRHLSSKRLAREELYLVGPSRAFGPLQAGRELELSRLGDFPLILPSSQHGLRQFLEAEAAKASVTLNVNTEIDALPHINSLVASGRGYSVLPLPAVSEDLEKGRLSAARIKEGALCRTLCLVRNPGRVVTSASVRTENIVILLAERMIQKGRWSAQFESAA